MVLTPRYQQYIDTYIEGFGPLYTHEISYGGKWIDFIKKNFKKCIISLPDFDRPI